MADRPLQTAHGRWIAAGVQHEVMLRAMPAIRHDLVGPLSVTRMGTAVLKRHLAKDPVDGPAAIQRVEQLDSQLETLVNGIRALRHWDLHHGDRAPSDQAVHIALELARPALALRGVGLTAVDRWETRAAEAPVSLGALMYLVLASVFYLQDDAASLPAVVVVDIGAGGEVLIKTAGSASPDSAGQSADTEGAMPIDRDAVACLAEHLGWRVELTATTSTIFPP